MAIPLKYNIRSLFVRRLSTTVTIITFAVVIAIFLVIMALAEGIRTTLVATGEPLNIMVLEQGNSAEVSSSVSQEATSIIGNLPAIRKDDQNQALISPEIVVLQNLPKRGAESEVGNVVVRGISPKGFQLRSKVRLISGRMFQPGLREAVVSRAIAGRFQDTALGEQFNLGKGDWAVVGIFDAQGTAFDSEIWADVNQIASEFNRTSYSSVLLQAANESAQAALIQQLASDSRLHVNAAKETSYYNEQAGIVGPIRGIGMFLLLVMGVGAIFAAMNTMYASIANRTREIATLRAFGFSRFSILFSFLIESCLLALIGGALGCLLALPLNGVATGTTNSLTYSEITFHFHISISLIVNSIILSLIMGLFGGFIPARSAARQPIASALRAGFIGR